MIEKSMEHLKKLKIKKQEKIKLISLLSALIFFMTFFWIYTNGWIYIANQMAPVSTWPPEMSIIPSTTLNGEHYPEYPKIGEIILFKGVICGYGGCKPCVNCSIEITADVDYTNKLIIDGFLLNKSGEIEFEYNANPTWVKMSGYNATLFYRIPKPDFWETVNILFSKWPLSLGMIIATIIGTISGIAFIVSIFIRIYRYFKNGKKKGIPKGFAS